MKKFFAIFILFGATAKAVVLFDYQRPIWAMGMGGVYVPFPQEVDMPTSNAAYLAQVHSMGLELFTLNFAGPGLSAIQEFQDLPPASGIADVNQYMGKVIQTGLDARASFVAPNFGFSIYENFFLRSYLSNPLMPEWNIKYLTDYGLTMAFAAGVGPNQSVGLAIKRINRLGGDQAIGFDLIDQYLQTNDSSLILDQFTDRGVAYGMDISYLLMPPEGSAAPITTLVWKDVGYTTFQQTGGSSAPPSLRENLTLGLGYVFDGPGIDIKTGMEYRYITTKNVQLGKKLHFGMELSLPLIDVRAGLNQGYMTYGVGFNMWVLRFELAQYTEEMGEYPGQTPDSKLQIGITMDLSVDADFSLSTKDGKKRKLKQRR